MVRFKHRYLLVHLIFPQTLPNTLVQDNSNSPQPTDTPRPPQLSESGLISLLRESLSANFGDVGAGEVGGAFSIKYLSSATQILILRVAREHLRTIWAALTLLRRVGGAEVIARVLHVSGTIRKIQHAAISHDRQQILHGAAQAKTRSIKRKPGVTEPESETKDVEEDGVAAQLAESEKAIMEIEA